MFYGCPFNCPLNYNPYINEYRGFERGSQWTDWCNKHCQPMTNREKYIRANNCQGYRVFMCFIPQYSDYDGYWTINATAKGKGRAIIAATDDKGIFQIFDIMNVKCISECR
ncbi:hypothetical protein [Clostridium rectalis]|uniref:hypothetical protein n=1 Tax=Clostridium rectalis TaxID=2040295 RepID=UPI000F641201|nr:hypothetical protein [Clostridium rectalis]